MGRDCSGVGLQQSGTEVRWDCSRVGLQRGGTAAGWDCSRVGLQWGGTAAGWGYSAVGLQRGGTDYLCQLADEVELASTLMAKNVNKLKNVEKLIILFITFLIKPGSIYILYIYYIFIYNINSIRCAALSPEQIIIYKLDLCKSYYNFAVRAVLSRRQC